MRVKWRNVIIAIFLILALSQWKEILTIVLKGQEVYAGIYDKSIGAPGLGVVVFWVTVFLYLIVFLRLVRR